MRAPSQIPRLADRPPAQAGYGVASNDANRDNARKASEISKLGWSVHYGTIDASFAGLGWHMVTVSDGRGRRTAVATSRDTPWGSQEDNSYPIGSNVIVAVNSFDHDNVFILGQAPVAALAADASFSQIATLGPVATTAADPLFQLMSAASKGGWIYTTADGPPIDSLICDWRVSNSLGGYILVSPLELTIAVDEVTYIRANTLEQEIEISGRKLDARADGIELFTPTPHMSVLKLGGGLQFLSDPEIAVEKFDALALAGTDNDFIYTFTPDPILVFSTYHFATPSGSLSTYGGHISCGGGPVELFQDSFAMVCPSSVKFLDYPSDGSEQFEGVSVFPPEDLDSRKALTDSLEQWKNTEFPLHFQKPLSRMASLTQEFLESNDNFIHVDSANGAFEDVMERLRTNESVYSVPPDLDVDIPFSGQQVGTKPVAAWITKLPDGSIFIGNETGGGIRITGTGVFIEGPSVRIAASKDVSIVGRDVNALAGRNVTLQANNHGRFYTGKNLNLIGATSHKGGVLIESRGYNSEFELPADAEDAVFAGVTVRAPRAQVACQAQDVILDAGVLGSGSLLLFSRSGSTLIAASNMIATHCVVNTMLYGGSDPSKPETLHWVNYGTASFDADMKVKNGWFDGSVSARNHIQSIYGQMADVDGVFGKVQNVAWFDQAISQYRQNSQQVMKRYQDFAKDVKARHADAPGVLSQKIRPNLAGGFVPTHRITEHYGTLNMQTTTSRVFQSHLGIATTPLYSLGVAYREGGSGEQSTYGWPGNMAEIVVPAVSGVRPLDESLFAMFGGESPSQTTITEESVAEALGTIQ